VNIPHTVRNTVDASFAALAASTARLLAEAEAVRAAQSQEGVDRFVGECNGVLQGFGTLFAKAKQEVYLLMREDSYKRWRRTEGFSNFIMDSLKGGKH
jgi:hypothetical protein